MSLYDSELIPVRLRGAWGFIDRSGRLAIDPQYGSVERFSEGLAVVSLIDWAEVTPKLMAEARHGYIDSSGTLIIPPRDRWSSSFYEGRARCRIGAVAELAAKDNRYYLSGGLYGFIDSTGNDIIPAIFDKAGDFRESRAVVCKDNVYGFIDCDGQTIVPPGYGFAWNFRNGFARVSVQGGTRNVSIQVGSDEGRSALSRLFFGSYQQRKIVRRREWLQGFVDFSGVEVIKPQFSHATDFSEGVAAVTLTSGSSSRSMFIDESGASAGELPSGVTFHSAVSAGLLAASIADKGARPISGWLDLRGEWRIEPRFAQTFPFSYGLGLFLDNGRYGYVDLAGEIVIPARYSFASSFRDGYAAVEESEKFGIIDEVGQYIWREL